MCHNKTNDKMATVATSTTTTSSRGPPITSDVESFGLTASGAAAVVVTLQKSVRFNDKLEYLPPDVDETDEEDEYRWFSVSYNIPLQHGAIKGRSSHDMNGFLAIPFASFVFLMFTLINIRMKQTSKQRLPPFEKMPFARSKH